ncbi:hypothetical protein [Amycolatopsis albispora]|nr:hypothetical protein [Amycolatopsis albispora]
MTWARHGSTTDPAADTSYLAGVKAEEKIHRDVQEGRAARTVAQHSSDARECAELLEMLGISVEAGRRQ